MNVSYVCCIIFFFVLVCVCVLLLSYTLLILQRGHAFTAKKRKNRKERGGTLAGWCYMRAPLSVLATVEEGGFRQAN